MRVVRKVVDTAVHTHSIFPKGIEGNADVSCLFFRDSLKSKSFAGTDLTFDMIKPFFGKNRLGNLNSLIYGNENLELTGLQYWKHRCRIAHTTDEL